MRHLSYAVGMLMLGCVACSDNLTLEVQVVTSIVPGAEFNSVEIERLEPTSPYDGAAVLERVQTRASFGDDFVHGFRVAAFSDFEAGDQVVQVRLRRANGTLLIARRVRVTVSAASIVRVHLTPDCVGVTCPAPAGSPSLTECLGGQCVDERCVPPNGEFCPEIVFCNADADCPAPVSACAQAACVEGICQVAPLPDACAESEYCNPSSGCEPEVVLDAGMPDQGLLDADVPDLGEVDAGPEVPDGSTCGGLCALTDDPCRTGVVDCTSGVATCVPYALRPVGTSCRGTGFCNAVGECDTCRDGSSCSVGCSRGTVDCSWGYERCVLDSGLGPVDPGTSCSSTHACVEGDTCDASSVCLENGTCGTCSVEGLFCWSDPDELYAGCAYGVRSCALGGACVVNMMQPHGMGCGFCTFDGEHTVCAGSCDGMGACVACNHNEACVTENGCGTGRRDCGFRCSLHGGCGHDGYEVGLCALDDPYAPGTTCASGVCDGNGLCITPLHAKHLGRTATYGGGCVVTDDDGVACWQRSDDYSVTISTVVGFPDAITQVSGAATNGCALTDVGEVWCWDATLTPVRKAMPSVATLVDGTAGYGCAVATSGQLYCWGPGYLLGTGDAVDQPEPVAVPGLDNIVDISLGSTSTALRATGEVLRWGGPLISGTAAFGTSMVASTYIPGAGSYVLTPATVDDIDDASAIAQNSTVSASCAVRPGGELWCWGPALAAGVYPYGLPATTAPARVPVPFTDITKVAVIYGALCTLRSTGEYWCFGGWNALGRGGHGDFGEPGSIANVDHIVDTSYECGITEGGNVFCWQANGYSWYSGAVATVPSFLPAESRM